MRYYWNQYSPYVAGVLIAFLLVMSFAKCDKDPVVLEKPTVTVKEVHHTDTVLKQITVRNDIYIPIYRPTLNDSTRAVLDTNVVQDSAKVKLHVEFNKTEEQFENVMAAFTVPVKYKEFTKYVDREIRVDIPVPAEDTDDLQWFGIGSVAGILLSIIAALSF